MDAPPQGDNFTWYHIVVTTYGAWLDGDARGFRTRHHREHVEGDYRNPPPREMYAARRQRSRESLRQPPVVLGPEWRALVGQALVERMEELGAFVLCAGMAAQHGHLLVKMPRGQARARVGVAKKHAWFVARAAGWQNKLWGVGSKATPVLDRRHQFNAYRYILAHGRQGAWIRKWEKPPSPGSADPGQEIDPGLDPSTP